MDDINPYAPPTVDTVAALPVTASSSQDIWRDGRDLVMHKNARLPSVCVKSGVPIEGRGIVRKMSWHTPWLALLFLLGAIGALIYVVLALVLSKKATIEIPLSSEEKSRRNTRLLIWWIIGLGAIALMVGCFVALINVRNNGAVFGLCLFGSFISMLAALLGGQSAARILRPTKITDTHVWLRGVHPLILGQLSSVPPLR